MPSASARRRPKPSSRPPRFFRRDGNLPESLTLEYIRPPGFEPLSHDAWQALLAGKIHEVETTAALARSSRGLRILGRARVLRQRPTDRPASHEPRRQLSPRVASLNKWAHIEALRRNKTFVAAYQHARTLWQAGLDAIFPIGTYWLRRFAGVPVTQDPAPA